MTEDQGKASSSEAGENGDSRDGRKRRQTDGFEWWLRRVRLLGDADDPLFFVGICLLAAATVAALIVSLGLEHGHEFRDVSFKLAGGVLVALGAYTAVRTIISNRANSASQTFTSMLALLADDSRTADAARIGAIVHLPELARRRGADPAAIEAVIDQLERSGSPLVKDAADEARRQFPKDHEKRAPDHGVR